MLPQHSPGAEMCGYSGGDSQGQRDHRGGAERDVDNMHERIHRVDDRLAAESCHRRGRVRQGRQAQESQEETHHKKQHPL